MAVDFKKYDSRDEFKLANACWLWFGLAPRDTVVQVADVSYDFPTNALENDVTQRFVRDTADISYDFPTNANEDDVNMRFVGDIADVSYDYPSSNEFATDEYRRPPPGFQDESRRPPPDFQRG